MTTPQHSAPVQTRRTYYYYCGHCHDNWQAHEPRGDGGCPHCDFPTVREIFVHLELAAIGNPISAFDYRAFFDGEEEANQCGFGCTKAEAVNDLISNWGDA